MDIDVGELHHDHVLVRAARAMVNAHANSETLTPAIELVHELFPDLTRDQLILLWLGVNAKDREGLDN